MEWWQTFFDDEWYAAFYGQRAVSEKLTETEAQAAARILQLEQGQSVLDIGCGWGRHCFEFAKLGCEAHGMDFSHRFISMANNELSNGAHEGMKCVFAQADARDIPYPDGKFDGIVSMYTSYGFFESEEDNRQYLTEVERLLKPGGSFFLDVKNYLKGPFSRQTYSVLEDNSAILLQNEWFDFMAGRHRRRWQVIKNGEKAYDRDDISWRVYTPVELRSMVSSVGMIIEGMYGDWNATAFSTDSPRLIVIIRKEA